MTKKKTICRYELLCLALKKSQKLITSLENFLGRENITEIQTKNWKPTYEIKQLSQANYLLVSFTSTREKIPLLEKNVLSTASHNFLSRYNLINLTDEKKIRIRKKNEQN